MEIKVNKVEGKTNKNGSKQGRLLTITKESSVKGFFQAITDTGNEMKIWNVNGDWSKIGLFKPDIRRCTFSTDFEIIK